MAGLKLYADWVILSACNTAADGAEGAEALSGLARAFFYAGARALLVSHWAVYSDATVKLITGAVGRMAADHRVGRAEALRRSILALINKRATRSGSEREPPRTDATSSGASWRTKQEIELPRLALAAAPTSLS